MRGNWWQISRAEGEHVVALVRIGYSASLRTATSIGASKEVRMVPGKRLQTMCRFMVVMFFGLLLASGAAAQAEGSLTGQALVEALRGGGHNLYFRHAATDWSQGDRVREAGDWMSCEPERMRQLSDSGRRASQVVGEAMRALGIPVGAVFASPYCRTVETARLLGLGPVETTTDIMNLRSAGYFGGPGAIVARARARLATSPERGTNNVYVAHGNVARAATGVYPGEGECLVFRPDEAGGFVFVGRIPPGELRRLAVSADEASGGPVAPEGFACRSCVRRPSR